MSLTKTLLLISASSIIASISIKGFTLSALILLGSIASISFILAFLIYYGVWVATDMNKFYEESIESIQKEADKSIEENTNKVNAVLQEIQTLREYHSENQIDLPCNFCKDKTLISYSLKDDIFVCKSCGERNAIHTSITTTRISTPLKTA